MSKVITRFPPSPTGPLHIGSVRTALFNYLFAKQKGGTMVFRSEDTDKERSQKIFEDDILASLTWLGLTWDEGPFRQSERSDIYKRYLSKLVAEGKAYISKESALTEGGRAEVIRFKNPNTKVRFTDLIRGEIEVDTTDLGDFVIAKSLEEPLYHLAVVVDDFEMGVTHVIRGDDGISNTPRQLLIQAAIGAPRPVYAHLPLVLAPDRSKLSKRKHGKEVSIDHYRQAGYLPSALINFLALLGWNPGTDKELFTLDELIKEFNLEKVQKGGAVFSIEKLNWINKEHIKLLPKDVQLREIASRIPAGMFRTELLEKLLPVILERITVWSDVTAMVDGGDLAYYAERPSYSPDMLYWKGEKDVAKTIARLKQTQSLLATLPDEAFTKESVKNALWDFATAEGRGQVLWPLRIALSGREKSPDPFILSEILGKREVGARIDDAIARLV